MKGVVHSLLHTDTQTSLAGFADSPLVHLLLHSKALDLVTDFLLLSLKRFMVALLAKEGVLCLEVLCVG